MGRKSDIWFSRSRRGYFTYIEGRRHRLKTCEVDDKPGGPFYNAALEEFKRVINGAERTSPLDQSVKAAVERWCESLETGAARTHGVARSTLSSFTKLCGHISLDLFRPFHVNDWLNSRRGWSDTTKACAIQRLRTCFRWNKRLGYTSRDPLDGVEIGAAYSVHGRGPEFLLPDSLIQLMLNGSNAAWVDFLTALWRTGARPGEIAAAERRHYLADDHVIYFRADDPFFKHKTARTKKHGDSNRTIHLHPDVEEIVKRNAKQGKWLFPTAHGKRLESANIYRYWQVMLNTKPVAEWHLANDRSPKHTIPYSFRHTWITQAILKGTNIKLVADMCGTSAEKIEKHYSHATANRAAMREAYLKSL